MPEYLAPGVYVEEVSYRAKSIEGVSTTTTGFVGPARYGPVDLEPDVITSLGEFERVYGDRQKLQFGRDKMDNYLWHAARAFFQEGGRRLYVSRVFKRSASSDGHAKSSIGTGDTALNIRARFQGAAGSEMRVRLTLRLSQNILSTEPELDSSGRVVTQNGRIVTRPKVGSLLERDVVWISNLASPISPLSPPRPEGPGDYYIATQVFDSTTGGQTWQFNALDDQPADQSVIKPVSEPAQPRAAQSRSGRRHSAGRDIEHRRNNADGDTQIWDDIPLDSKHVRAGSPDSLFDRFSEDPGSLSQALRLPIVIEGGTGLGDGLDVLQTLLTHDSALNLRSNLDNLNSSDNERSIPIRLTGGNDGIRPTASDYEGEASPTSTKKTGLKALEGIDDISIVAAPGSSYGYENGYRSDAQTIMGLLIAHAENMRYRIAVLDSGNDQAIADVRALRARLDSKYAALYYPWVRILDPVTQREINFRQAVSSPGSTHATTSIAPSTKRRLTKWSISLLVSSSS